MSREIDLPEYVNAQAVLEHSIAAIRELWGMERDAEIIEKFRVG